MCCCRYNKSFLNSKNSGVVKDPDFFNFTNLSKTCLLLSDLGAGTFTGFISVPRAFCNFSFVDNGIRMGFNNLLNFGNFGGKIGNKGNLGGIMGKIGNNGNLGILGNRGNNGNLGIFGNLGNLRNFLERMADFTRDLIFAFAKGFEVSSLLGSRGIDLGSLGDEGLMFIVTGA